MLVTILLAPTSSQPIDSTRIVGCDPGAVAQPAPSRATAAGIVAAAARLTATVRRLLLLAFIWGWSFLFIKVAVAGLTPSTVAWTRIALGAAVLVVILRKRHIPLPRDPAVTRHLAVVALAGNVVPWTLLAWAQQYITSALAAVLNAATPLFTAVLAAFALSERLRPVQFAGLVTGITGVTVAAGLGASDLHGSSLSGAVGVVGVTACYAIAWVYMRRHLVDLQPLVAAAGQLTLGTLLLAPLALGTTIVDGISLTPSRAGAILLLGVFGTGIAFVLTYGIVGELGATKASLVTYLVPVVAVIVGLVVLGEPFEWRLVGGGALTIGGVAAVTFGRHLGAAPQVNAAPAGTQPAGDTQPAGTSPAAAAPASGTH
jgi:drug/metabolite transporter (DMT)-like permease